MQIATANGTFSYTEDWNHIELPRRPTLAAANLLNHARQRTDISRWWFMRWPSDAVSLVGRSLNLDTGKTYKLMRQLREHSRGGSLRAELRYVVDAPPEGGRRPASGFYPIFALSLLPHSKSF